jgi:DNA helicase II / ATP-dependent DNA helicase PcrA
MASRNEAVIAAAGSGKTEYLLDAALAESSKRALIITYTNENLREINSRLWDMSGQRPSNVSTMTWFEFLLRHGVKPYQSYKTTIGRIRSINFISTKPPFSSRSEFDAYYLDRADNIYSDAVADLAYELDVMSNGRVVSRLEGIYDKLLVDEVQDMAGYDLEVLQRLLASRLQVVMVGDPRQAVYMTNRSNKNSQYRGAKLVDWINARVEEGCCTGVDLQLNYRCNQQICDFADSIYPSMPATTSANLEVNPHMGVILVHQDDITTYVDAYHPQELRWDRRAPLAGPGARNFGQVKGQSFPRVLIHATGSITEFIDKGTQLNGVAAAKFYVAVTRARHSVAIVTTKRSTKSALPIWEKPN